MILGPPLFANGTSSAVTEDSIQRQGSDHGACIWVLEVRDGGSWSGTLKVEARVIGAGKDGASDYPAFISIRNRNDDSLIDGDTGITAAGIYEVNLAGLEGRIEHTRVAGTVIVREQIVFG